MNTDLLRETQIELRVHDEQLRVPETLKPHFVKPKPPPQQPNENTPRYVYFYDVQPVSSKDLIAFVRHQTDQQDNLKRSQSYLEEWGNEAALDIADSTWENALHKADPSTHDTIVSSIARAVADLCTEQGTTPKVPPEQAALWGPSPEKQARANVRSETQSAGYSFVRPQDPWQLYRFEPVPNSAGPTQAPASDMESLREQFVEALAATAKFAEDADSPFAEAFRLGQLFLKEQLPESIEEVITLLATRGFSDRAREVALDKLGLREQLA